MKPSAFLTVCLALSCAGPPQGPTRAPHASQQAGPATPQPAPVDPSASSSPLPAATSSSSSTITTSADAPFAPGPVVAFDPPYKLGAQPVRADQAQDLDAWNTGGRDGSWHPEPRVMVDRVKLVRGQLSEAMVLRETRKQHYWPIRRCYDAALSRDQKLHGKLRVQFTIRRAGTVKGARAVGKPSLADAQAVDCLLHSLGSLKFPSPPRAEATVALDIGLNPGDLPVKPTEDPPVEPGPGAVDLHATQALVAGTAGHRIQQCYQQAVLRLPSLWGRLALRADLDAHGTLRELIEHESSFPDPATTTCVIDAVRKVAFPAPHGGEVRLVVPFRFGLRPR